MRSRKKGFTLIELLVVIAIIAILAAILYPVFARIKEQGHKSNCQNNLKQLAGALKVYISEWGNMPFVLYDSAGQKHWYWPEQLMGTGRLTSKVFKCTSDEGPGGLSYTINRYLGGRQGCCCDPPPASGFMPMTGGMGMNVQSPDFPFPTKLVLFTDWQNSRTDNPQPGGGASDVSSRREGWMAYQPPARTADTRHLGKANYVFWDGHVECLRPEMVGRDSQGGGGSCTLQSPQLPGGRPQCGCAWQPGGVNYQGDPWWGPGMLAAQAKAGANFQWNIVKPCPRLGDGGQNVWCGYKYPDGHICGSVTYCTLKDIEGRTDVYEHPFEWYYGLDPKDPGAGPNGHRFVCLADLTHVSFPRAFGTMPTFNPFL